LVSKLNIRISQRTPHVQVEIFQFSGPYMTDRQHEIHHNPTAFYLTV
jgi:hypothetical protein